MFGLSRQLSWYSGNPAAVVAGTYLVHTSDTTPYLTIYKLVGGVYTKLSNPSTIPTASSGLLGWNFNNSSIAFTKQNAPYYMVYNVSGDTFTNLTVGTGPTNSNGFAWKRDGTQIALSYYSASAGYKIVDRSGDTFSMGSGTLINEAYLDYSPTQLAGTIAGAGPYLVTWSVSGTTYTRNANPSSQPSGGGQSAISFNSAGTSLAVSNGNASPYFKIYNVSGSTYTALASPPTGPVAALVALKWNPAGTSLAVGSGSGPQLTIYNRSGDTLTKLTNPTQPAGQAQSITWSADGLTLAVAHPASPFITIYTRSGDTFTKQANPTSLPPGNGRGIGFNN